MNAQSTIFKTVFGSLVLFVVMLAPEWGWGQPWTYDFGTGTGTYNTPSGVSTTFLPTPTSGTARVRVGTGGGSFNLENPGLVSLGTATELRSVAPTSTSVNKVSVYDYTAGKTTYVMYKMLLGNNTGGTTATSGTWYCWVGDGAMYSDNSAFTGAQVFTGLRWVFGTSGSITTSYRNGGAWTTISGTPFSQGNVYTVEIYCNNSTSSQNYTRGTTQSIASNTFDLWVNGTLVGDDLAKALLANDANIDSWMFYGESSTSNVANIFLDDFEYSNSFPTGATVPTVTTQAVTVIGTTTATGNGNITVTGGANATARGFCYDVYANPDPDLFDTHTTESGSFGTGAFTGSIISISAETRYKVVAYATNPTGTGYGTAVNFWTLSLEPSAYSTIFSNTVVSQTQIDLSFDAASSISNTDGYIILQKTGSALTGVPTDGNAYSVGNTIGDATVAALVTNTAATSASITGLSAGTHYYFTIMPFNYNGTNNETYNYKTDGTIPSTDGTTLAPLAATSEVSGPALGSQPNPTLISSLVTTDAAAVRVFDMDIYDYGVDGQPTKITQVTIKVGTGNTANWLNTIQGVKLSTDAGSTFVTIGAPTITASAIVIPITSGNLNIPDNSALTLSLYIYLKNSGLTDNQVLEFKVDAAASSHGFTADGTGSTFLATFTTVPVSNQMLIDVVATRLNFVQQPTNVGTSLNITPAVTVSANDANGNRDLDYITNVSITATGATLNGSPVSVAPASGLATFSTLSFSTTGTGVTLYAASGALIGATSTSFDVLLLPTAGEIVINQVSPDYGAAADEYIELLNKTNKTFDLSMLKIEYRSASTGNTGSAGGSLSGTLGPYQYWLLSPNATITVGLTSSLARDGAITTGFAFPSGQLALRLIASPNTIIDGLAYGTVTVNIVGEGSPASSPPTDGGLTRTSDGFDADENSTDFTTVANANIYLRNHNSYNYSSSYTLPSTSYSADVVISGSSTAAVLSGNTTIAGKLTILAGSLTIGQTQTLTVTGTLTNSAGNSGLVIKSDATGTGSLIHNTTSVPATVERYITGTSQAWHFLSSPVASQSISPDFTAAPADYDFFAWYEPAVTWVNFKNTTVAPTWNTANGNTDFTPGKGYLVEYLGTGPTKQFQGSLNTGPISSALTNSGTGTYIAFNLAGNPYPCAIDWKFPDGPSAWTRTSLVSSGGGYDMSIWNDAAGQYGSYNSASLLDAGSNGVTRYIPADQGFMVKAASGGNMGMGDVIKVHSNQAWLKSTDEISNILRMKVSGNANSYSDEIVIEFGHQTATGGAEKMFSFYETAPSLYTVKPTGNYSIDFRGEPGAVVIPVNFNAGIDGNYTLTASQFESFTSTTVITLEDVKANKTQNLMQNPVYTFSAGKNDEGARFLLHFGGTFGVNEKANAQPITIYASGSTVYISNVSGTMLKGEVIVFNMIGQSVMHRQLSENPLTKINFNGRTGYYLVKVVTIDNAYSGKVFINQE